MRAGGFQVTPELERGAASGRNLPASQQNTHGALQSWNPQGRKHLQGAQPGSWTGAGWHGDKCHPYTGWWGAEPAGQNAILIPQSALVNVQFGFPHYQTLTNRQKISRTDQGGEGDALLRFYLFFVLVRVGIKCVEMVFCVWFLGVCYLYSSFISCEFYSILLISYKMVLCLFL